MFCLKHPKFTLSVMLIMQISACSKPPEVTPAAQQALVVDAITVQHTNIPDEVELPGRVEAYRIAEVRARVSGIVVKRLYSEGQSVQAGTPLFQINPEQLQASKLEAEAELARAEANVLSANDKLQRYETLVTDQSVSQRDFRAAQAESQLAKAELASAMAKLHRAKLDLGYAHVTAPIAGVARRALVTEGALVSKEQATQLTTIEQVNPVYVNFSQSSSEVFHLRKSLREGERKGSGLAANVNLILPDGTTYATAGKLIFEDISVNPTTDAVLMRAIFENPQQVLMPGTYVRIKLRQASNPNAMLIPRVALIRDQFISRVWVVNANNVLESREVQVGRVFDKHWVIERGLQVGERVVVSHVETLTAGSAVSVKLINTPQNPTTAGPLTRQPAERP